MLWTVARVELRSLRREPALWIVLAAFGALVAYATLAGYSITRGDIAALTSQVRGDEARRAALREAASALPDGPPGHAEDPRDPLAVGARLAPRAAVLPPGPLSIVAVGQRDVLPQSHLLTVETRAADAGRDDGASPARRANGPFDLAFVVVFLLPLVVIALSYDLLASERERGTLGLVLSQPVSLASFVLGKALARVGVVAVAGLALCLAGPLLVGAPLSGEGAVRLALYAALLLAYVALWFLVAIAVDAWGRSPSANALALVGLWLGLSVVVPGLVSVAVDTLHPSPSRVELVSLAREASRSAEARESSIEGDHGKVTPAALLGRRTVEVQSELEREMSPVLERFDRERGLRQGLVDRLRFVSPAIVMAEGLADVAGSSVGRHRAFDAQVAAFHADLRRFFFERIERGASLTVADYDAMPRFEFREPAAGELVSRVAGGLVGLLVPAAAALALALSGLRRQALRGFR